MKLTTITFILPILILVLLVQMASGFQTFEKMRRSSNPIAGRYIVVLNNDEKDSRSISSQPESVSTVLSRIYGGQVDKIYNNVIRGYSTEMSPAQAESLSRDSRVKYVEEDTAISAVETQTQATWGLDRIDQHSLPIQGEYTYNTTGSGVNVYIVDSGIRYTHMDFGGRAQFGFDAINDGQAGNDCFGHGTHVAGTVGSFTYGVAKNVNLFSVRVFDCGGSGSISGVIAGVDWITANHIAPAVANMSLTAGGASSVLDEATTNSIASGVTYVIASANDASDACNYSPARVPNAITVGATGDADQRAPFSNYGPCVDLFAPGYRILSTGIASDTATAIKHGTSMSSPHAAGVAALFLQENPTASPAQVTEAIKAGATASILTNVGTGSPNLLLFSRITEVSQPITNVSPSDGTTYMGNQQMISWTNTAGFNRNVSIELSADGGATFPTVVVSNIPNTGSYLWTVPDVPTSQARIRVREYDQAAPAGTSTGNFTISYSPTATTVSVSGRVVRASGRGILGAVVTLTDTRGRSVSARTGTFGYYVIEGVVAGEVYLAEAGYKRLQFQTQILTVNDNVFSVDFNAIE